MASSYGSRIQPPSKPPSTPSFMPPMRSHSSPSSGLMPARRPPRASILRAVGGDRISWLTRIVNVPAARHLLQQPILLDRCAGIADARQPGGIQLRCCADEFFDGQRLASAAADERLRPVDQLAVQLAVRATGNPAAGLLRVSFVIFHLRSAAELRMYSCPPRTSTTGFAGATVSRSSRYGSRCSFSCASCQSLLRDDDVVRAGLFTRAATACEHVGDRPRARQIDAGTAARLVQVTVREAGNRPFDRADRRFRRGPSESPDFAVVVPTAMNLPFAIAIACAMENCASTVMTWPLIRIVSASMVGCPAPTARRRRQSESAGPVLCATR